MTLVRYNPYFNMHSMMKAMPETFKIDLEELEDKYVVTCELPGVDKDNIQIEMEDGTLSISTRFEENKEEKDEERNFLHRERKQVQSTRKIYLKDIKEEEIQASLKDGLLQIEIPMDQEKNKKKLVEIN